MLPDTSSDRSWTWVTASLTWPLVAVSCSMAAAIWFRLVTRSFEIADHPLELARRTLDHLARLANIVIDVLVLALRLAHQGNHAADVAADLLGGDIDPLGQLAHLVGHHREAAALLAGPRRLDGRVERQQVGLVGNILDQAGDLP